MAIVNCPNGGCDTPLDIEGYDDGDVIECSECGELLIVSNDGTKLTVEEEEEPEEDDEEEDDE